MNRNLILAFIVGLGGVGCGASSEAAHKPTMVDAKVARAEADATRAKEEEHRVEEMRMLKGQLAVVKAEAKELRDALDRQKEFRRETVRIGSADAKGRGDEWNFHDPAIDTRGPRPVLRLYGERSASDEYALHASASTPELVIPEAPAGVPTKLDVVPLPGAPVLTARAQGGAAVPGVPIPVAGASAEELALAEYQAALSNIRDRKFGAALKGLHEFLVKHPKHAYADNALYWKGEVLYAQRQYGQALVTFEDVVVRFPRGNRVSDALLKAGLCHARMGNLKNARGYFQRLKSLFPDSVAARMASQEDVR